MGSKDGLSCELSAALKCGNRISFSVYQRERDMAELMAGDDLWLPQTASTIKFQEIRSQIAGMLNVDQSQIRPRTRLAAIVPPYRRNEILMAIVNPGQKVRQPQKSRLPAWSAEILFSSVLSLLCLFQPWFLVLLTLPISVFIASAFRSPQSTFWPPCLETMQELAISQTHYSREDAARGLWPRSEISAKVRWIIANQVGDRFDDITEDTRIVDLD